MTNQNTKNAVKQVLCDYLERIGQRKTPERFAILEEIYSHNSHFDIETLYIQMKNKNYQVCRATLYNTIELLLECGLVVKHLFGNNIAQYEKSYDNAPHEHMVCTHCGKVTEFSDKRLQQIIETAKENTDFNITSHSLYLYGLCANCAKKLKHKPL